MLTDHDDPTSEIEIIDVEGGADTLRVLPRPATRAHHQAVLEALQHTGEITLPEAIGQPTHWQRVRLRWRGTPLADWLRPVAATIETWPARAVPIWTVHRWLRRRTAKTAVVAFVAGLATVPILYVLAASLVIAVLADALLFAAHLAGAQ